LLVADGASVTEHWESSDPSPLDLAEGGTLVVTSAATLPPAAQERIARHLGRGSPPTSSVPPAGVVLCISSSFPELVRRGQVVRSLARAIGDWQVDLPPLVDRPEDLRPNVLVRLARAGLQARGEPVGIDPSALRMLLDHDWPGNDIELDDVLLRAALAGSEPRVTSKDLAQIGFRPATATDPSATPPPVSPSIRPRPRRPMRG
jgi:DNA-binding NtrC family response regulator